MHILLQEQEFLGYDSIQFPDPRWNPVLKRVSGSSGVPSVRWFCFFADAGVQGFHPCPGR